MNPQNPYPPMPVPAPPHPEGSLILSMTPMRGASRIPLLPGRALVFVDGNGTVVRPASYPNLLEAFKYRMRYEVDLSRRHTVFTANVPSATRPVSFSVTVETDWGVTDPVAVVENGLGDGWAFLRPRLLRTVRSIAHSYPIGEFIDLEEHLNRSLGQGVSHPEGVGAFHCVVRVQPDERYQGQLTQLDDAKHEITLSDLKGSWVNHINGEWDLLKRHLREHPDEIPQVLKALQDRADKGNARDDERLRLLLGSGLLQDMADLETGLPIIQQDARFISNDAIEGPRLTARQDNALPQPSPEVLDEDEDVMPADLVPEDNVTGWVRPPWQQDGA